MQRQTTTQDAGSVFPPNDAPERLATDVWRIPLPVPFALRMVNVYLVDGGPGNRVLFDAGLGLPTDEAALRAGLAEAGVALEDISTLVLTHAHPDHVGLSGMIHDASGAPVYMLSGEDETLYTVWGAGESAFAAVEHMYEENGLPAQYLLDAQAGVRRVRRMPRLAPREVVQTLADGETLRLGEHTYSVVWTPGHADHHMCLLRDDDVFFAGDHILPHITPNIGWYPNARPDPLRDYYASLARVRDLPARLVLPGHGRPFAGLAQRVDALRAHNEERGQRVRALLAASPSGIDAGSIAADIFGVRLRTGDDWRFALVETLAHLEYLKHDGLAARDVREGHILYRPLSGTGDSAA